MSRKLKVLFIVTSCSGFDEGGKNHPTGWYLPEAAHPYYELVDHAEIVFASPKGGSAPLDPSSVEAFKEDEQSVKFLKEKKSLYENTEKLSSFVGKSNDFAAIFYVGGHGPVWDLTNDATSHKLIAEFAEAGKIVSAVCHAPIVLAKVKLSNGEYLVKGEPVTGFSNSEEDAVGLTQYMPELPETLLKEYGGKFEKADKDWGEKVCIGRGGKLITGQNPASAAAVGKAILKAIS